MILTTVRPFYFAAQYKGYENEQSPDNPDISIKVWKEPITIYCAVNNNPLGELTLYTDALLQNDGLISYVRSRTYGSALVLATEDLKTSPILYPIGTKNGAVWRIVEGQPLLDSWGNKNRYRYRCLLLVPKTGSVTEAAPTEASSGSWWT